MPGYLFMNKIKNNPSSISPTNPSLIEKITSIVPALIVVYNINTGQYIFVNDALKKILGYPKEKLLNEGLSFIAPLVHPDDLPRIMAENTMALEKANSPSRRNKKKDSIITFEYRLRHKDGSYRWMHSDGVVFDRDSNGKVEHVMNVSVDITKRKETEIKDLSDRLRTQGLLELAQKAGHIGAFEWFLKDNTFKWTPELENLYGLRVGSFGGKYKDWAQWVHPEDLEKTEAIISAALKKRVSYDVEYRIIRPDGKYRWIQSKADVYFDEKKHPEKVVGINIDITSRKDLEHQKDEFISIASHELKTPLTTIKSYTEVLKNILEENNRASEYLNKMEYQISRLSLLVNDLLDVSRIQSGKVILSKERFDLERLIKDIIEDLHQNSQKHTIIYKGHIKKKIYADKYRISQVLINLLSNAIKYSPKADKIIVSTSSNKTKVVVKIQDFGIGINKKDLGKIFEPFFQVNNRIRQSFSGLGLGLHISSEIIKKHGGEISVKSVKGQGSTFSFNLPIN